jgi:DNA invertase Pin-like site-specific DNA recombinase
VGLYARISSDREGDGLGVARQLRDCERLAADKGWEVAGEYVDDDVSAYSGRGRPEYARLLDDLRDGIISGVVVYHLDRLHRQPKELEEFFDVCKTAGVYDLATVTGRINLADPDGQFQARILGAVAKKESDDKSRRIRRKHAELAERGKRSGGGSRAYGFERDGVTVRDSEAVIVRECARRFLSGESVRSICSDLNTRGVQTATGKQWSPQTLRRMLGSGRISGQREHRGEIITGAEWPAIIDPAETAQIRARLADPDRRTNKSARRYLLTGGLLRCGHCGEALVARPRSGGLRRYACATGPGFSGCGGTSINADPVEAFVVEMVLYRLDSPELTAAASSRGSEPDAERWQAEIDGARKQLEELAQAYGEQQITMAELIAARKPIEARLTAARKQLGKLSRTAALDGYLGNPDALRESWDTLDLSRQRAIVAALLDRVEVGPARRGYNRFDDSRLRPVWRA